jgi:hypothetical protein
MFSAWQDTDKKRPLLKKANDAIESYREKRNAEPTLLLVWPAAVVELEDQLGDVEVRASGLLREGVFYVGTTDDLITS